MAAKYLIDSDVLIEILRNNVAIAAALKALDHAGETLCYSPITKAEVYHGLRTGEEERTERVFAAMECLWIDDAIGQSAGEYLRKFRKSHGVQLADALIAATARHHQANLITLNRRHYPMADIQFHDISRTRLTE
ncbi:MAG: type II toxin-antitoxin system VapC family toxin [Anaerolineae bacterium]|nr:type II toxin-antitoxin system VapC family toxin [Anaerolineae bacterium]